MVSQKEPVWKILTNTSNNLQAKPQAKPLTGKRLRLHWQVLNGIKMDKIEHKRRQQRKKPRMGGI